MTIPDLRRLRALAPGMRLLKAVHVTGEDALGRALSYAGAADALVLDSRTADRLGGTGLTHDWSVSARIVEAVTPLPVYLAGGLRPENVGEAVARVRPAGVDVNSGVEDASGRKDAQKMREFVARARAGCNGSTARPRGTSAELGADRRSELGHRTLVVARTFNGAAVDINVVRSACPAPSPRRTRRGRPRRQPSSAARA